MVIFDTNVFIFAKNQFYHPGFCQGFWDVLDILYEKQEWCSLNFVYNELVKTRNKNNILQMQDYVAIWATARKEYFKIFDANIELRQIQDYLNKQLSNNKYNKDEINNFNTGADPYLISYAMKHNLKIITNETYINESKYDDPKNKLKIKIPNICKQFNVKYGMIWQFLYEMKDIVNLVQKSR